MTDLETAAAESLASVRSLDQKAIAATDRMRALRGSVEAIDHQCDATWQRFEETLAAFRKDVHEQTELLDTEGQQARHAVDEARAQVEGHAPLVEQALEQAGLGTQALREHIQAAETEVMPLVDELETVARAVVDAAHKAKTELEAAAAEVRHFMEDEVVDALHQMQDAVRKHTADWRTTVEQEHRVPAHADETDWSTRLAEVQGTVEESFAGAVQHADDVARFVVEELKRACDDALRELDALCDPLVKELEELKSQAESRGTDAGGAGDTLEHEVRDTIDVLEDASSKLVDIAVELAKFYFTGL